MQLAPVRLDAVAEGLLIERLEVVGDCLDNGPSGYRIAMRVSTRVLACLATLLPLLGLLTAQFSLGCESSSCGWWDIVAAMTLPIALLWIVIIGVLIWRVGTRLAHRSN